VCLSVCVCVSTLRGNCKAQHIHTRARHAVQALLALRAIARRHNVHCTRLLVLSYHGASLLALPEMKKQGEVTADYCSTAVKTHGPLQSDREQRAEDEGKVQAPRVSLGWFSRQYNQKAEQRQCSEVLSCVISSLGVWVARRRRPALARSEMPLPHSTWCDP
jgi:hypothetical protein